MKRRKHLWSELAENPMCLVFIRIFTSCLKWVKHTCDARCFAFFQAARKHAEERKRLVNRDFLSARGFVPGLAMLFPRYAREALDVWTLLSEKVYVFVESVLCLFRVICTNGHLHINACCVHFFTQTAF